MKKINLQLKLKQSFKTIKTKYIRVFTNQNEVSMSNESNKVCVLYVNFGI